MSIDFHSISWTDVTTWTGNTYTTICHGPWTTKFIWLAKINGTWVFCRDVHRRRHKFTMMNGRPVYDYAINDLELIQKSAET